MIAIAMDGPAGAGKSSIARAVAKNLGYIYVDTGALYRTIGLAATEQKTDLAQEQAVRQLLEQISIELKFVSGEQRVLLDGRDVSEAIRTPEASMMASSVSALPPVRAYLLSLQRDMAETHDVIMDGRDIGTVVLPNAQLKFFLTASVECRAKRRYDELIAKGQQVRLEDVQTDIEQRDYQDSHRAIAPLVPAQDAEIVDNSWMTLDESVRAMTQRIRERLYQA